MDAELEVLRALEGVAGEVGPASLKAVEGLYRPLHDGAGTEARIARDLAYGPHERHRIDLFRPARAEGPAPVVAFIHGGAFVQGAKSRPESIFYDNVGRWAAASGFAGIQANYRLAPEAQWPAGAEDVAAILDWIAANAEEHGLDASRVFLMGHSSGAVHVATYAGIAPFAAQAERRLSGLILVSGVYNFLTAPAQFAPAAYFGEDRGVLPERSTVAALASSDLPLMIVAAQDEPRPFIDQAMELFQACAKARERPPLLALSAGHNHFSVIAQLGVPGNALGRQIQEFLALS